jgi:hypothetical protein
MKRSVARFLVFFVLVIASAATLTMVLPATLGPDASIQPWVPIALGALFAASALLAWLSRPDWTHLSAQSTP